MPVRNASRKRYKLELTAGQIGQLYVALNVEMGVKSRRVWKSIERQQLKIDERRRMKL